MLAAVTNAHCSSEEKWAATAQYMRNRSKFLSVFKRNESRKHVLMVEEPGAPKLTHTEKGSKSRVQNQDLLAVS